ncbi:hypothetical protein L195_g055000 [Trifolium pratense]|uniref:Uncharacterized protein n=1 Tax=Trifolium pratense TaxID=57577 RepID=A0A2K3KJ09_TRIPR|nr:hypothetical protein L195_g055000 [Trifolium pratense]
MQQKGQPTTTARKFFTGIDLNSHGGMLKCNGAYRTGVNLNPME